MIFTRTEETTITIHDPKINQTNFSILGGNIFQLKIPLAIARIAPTVATNKSVTAKDAVICSIFFLSVLKGV